MWTEDVPTLRLSGGLRNACHSKGAHRMSVRSSKLAQSSRLQPALERMTSKPADVRGRPRSSDHRLSRCFSTIRDANAARDHSRMLRQLGIAPSLVFTFPSTWSRRLKFPGGAGPTCPLGRDASSGHDRRRKRGSTRAVRIQVRRPSSAESRRRCPTSVTPVEHAGTWCGLAPDLRRP